MGAMSDSVDRVFVHALATVRRLPRTGSSRPPPSARLQLYGLYKQSMEGDVSDLLPRPTLPPPSPDVANTGNSTNNSVHRYASRDLRTREAQAEIEKWDAWHACAGMSSTEAKRRYITTLIETMKEYASGTAESRELVSELEFVWNQIRSQSGSDESEEGESPTRRLERSGLKRMNTGTSSPGPADSGGVSSSRHDLGGSSTSRLDSGGLDSRREQVSRFQGQNQGLRVLSPISQRSSDGIIENEELPNPEPDRAEDEDDQEDYASASEDKVEDSRQPQPQPQQSIGQTSVSPGHHTSTSQWRHQIESHLRQLTTELAALREQLSSSHMLSRSSFSIPTHLPLRRRIVYKISMWTRWLFWATIRQACIQLGLLVAVLVWGRLRGDRRVEKWCRERLKGLISWSRYVAAKTNDGDITAVAEKLRVL